MKMTRNNNPDSKIRKPRTPNSKSRIPDSEVRSDPSMPPRPSHEEQNASPGSQMPSSSPQVPSPDSRVPHHEFRISDCESRSESRKLRLRNPESGIRNPVLPLYPYQERWVRDASRFKIVVKATQIGYSFAAALEAVLDCLEHRTLWIVLSRGERQSLEFMQKVQLHAKALRNADSAHTTSFFENTSITQHEIKFPNGSRIIGLPANPDTARGYTGNMILDEFAFHQHDREIWAAAFGRISRGDLKLRVISTPNGCRGKYYELAKEAGLTAVTSDQWQVTSEKIAEAPARHSSLVTLPGPATGATCTPPSAKDVPLTWTRCGRPSAMRRPGSRNTNVSSSPAARTTSRST